MTFNYEKVRHWAFAPTQQRPTVNDCILYALSIGLGRDPLDVRELPFVYEKELRVLPTMAAVIATPGFWVAHPDTGIDLAKIFHAEQAITWVRPIPVGEPLTGRSRVVDLLDKGPGRGAVIVVECEVRDAADKLVWRVERSAFVRDAGGFGGTVRPSASVECPDRPPDQVVVLPTTGQQALIYRLNGDDNPLHADPSIARAAGYRQPILHGLCTFGMAGHAVLSAYCNYDETLLRSLKVRFSAPVFPGETIHTDLWQEADDEIVFRSRVLERGVTVINRGTAIVDAR